MTIVEMVLSCGDSRQNQVDAASSMDSTSGNQSSDVSNLNISINDETAQESADRSTDDSNGVQSNEPEIANKTGKQSNESVHTRSDPPNADEQITNSIDKSRQSDDISKENEEEAVECQDAEQHSDTAEADKEEIMPPETNVTAMGEKTDTGELKSSSIDVSLENGSHELNVSEDQSDPTDNISSEAKSVQGADEAPITEVEASSTSITGTQALAPENAPTEAADDGSTSSAPATTSIAEALIAEITHIASRNNSEGMTVPTTTAGESSCNGLSNGNSTRLPQMMIPSLLAEFSVDVLDQLDLEALHSKLLKAQQELSKRQVFRSLIEEAWNEAKFNLEKDKADLGVVQSKMAMLPRRHENLQRERHAIILRLSEEIGCLHAQAQEAETHLKEQERDHAVIQKELESRLKEVEDKVRELEANHATALTIIADVRKNNNDSVVKSLQAEIAEVKKQMDSYVAPVSTELLSELGLSQESQDFLIKIAQKRSRKSKEDSASSTTTHSPKRTRSLDGNS